MRLLFSERELGSRQQHGIKTLPNGKKGQEAQEAMLLAS
jgi:hypothetical protein